MALSWNLAGMVLAFPQEAAMTGTVDKHLAKVIETQVDRVDLKSSQWLPLASARASERPIQARHRERPGQRRARGAAQT
jgi:hypothetical protein